METIEVIFKFEETTERRFWPKDMLPVKGDVVEWHTDHPNGIPERMYWVKSRAFFTWPGMVYPNVAFILE